MRSRIVTVVAAAAALLGPVSALGQANAVHKTMLQKRSFPAPTYDTVTVKTVVDHGGLVAPHTHPGVEMAYIADGQATVKIHGRPDQSLSTGGSFSVPPETVHSVQNTGPGALTIISTYVVDKSKPIASPAK